MNKWITLWKQKETYYKKTILYMLPKIYISSTERNDSDVIFNTVHDIDMNVGNDKFLWKSSK